MKCPIKGHLLTLNIEIQGDYYPPASISSKSTMFRQMSIMVCVPILK